jgi:hypothetical protein
MERSVIASAFANLQAMRRKAPLNPSFCEHTLGLALIGRQ